MGSIFFLRYYLRSLTCYRRRAPASMLVRFRGKQEVSSGTLCSGCGYWIQLIFTNVFNLLQGASSSTPGVARPGSSHQDSLTPSSKMTANSTGVPSGRLATAIHQATRVLLFSEDVLQQLRSAVVAHSPSWKNQLARGVWFTSKSVAAEVNMII
jgi:hypothetical protein